MALVTGDLVGGRYCLEAVIGSGGMGDVWRARDRVLDRPVAIKLVYVGDPRKRAEISRDFLREARISAAIAHRNVVQIMDFGTHDDDVPYMVMELLEGETLAHVLGRADPVSFEWILAVITQALEGLSAAHDAGVIHRDLKPENIFLVHEREGVYPKILDFGISKVVNDGTGSAANLSTRGGRLLGTPAYMSPEQARGLRTLDKRTDVYSMGVVLYELLSGSMPFFSENPGDLLLMIVNERAPELVEIVPDVGKPLSDLVARAMSHTPSDRFADAREMRRSLLEVADTLLGSDAARKLAARVRPASWRKTQGHAETTPRDSPLARTATRLRPDEGTPDLSSQRGAKLQPASHRRLWIGALGAAAAVGIAITAVFLGRSSAAPAPRFIVVSADARSDTPASEPSTPEERPAQPAAPIVERLGPEKPSPPVERPGGAALAAQALTQSFRSQKAGVVKCVNEHSPALAQNPSLAVRLAVDGQGKVHDAQVSPTEIGASPLGKCIVEAVRGMRFPSQGAPFSFQVPLTTKRGS